MRIIARLDIKQNTLIKSVLYDGVRKLGDPEIFANEYYCSEIDELLIVNNTGSLYNTKLDCELLKKIRKKKALPITAGGGITSLDDAFQLIKSGSDKIVINSLIHKNYSEAKKIVDALGSSSVVGAIQIEWCNSVSRQREDEVITFYEMAREATNLSLKETLKKYLDLGVGEVLLTDVGRDGCYSGLNQGLLETLNEFKNDFPLLIGGGFSNKEEIKKFKGVASGIVISSSFHYKKTKVSEVVKYTNSL